MGFPTSMLMEIGYDESTGNCPELLAEKDRRDIEAGHYLRVSGEAECARCGYKYRMHPRVQGALWLRRACTGLVKL